MTGRLSGKRCIVTGAGSGIGRAIAERFVADGGTVLLSSHSMDLIERVCDSVGIIAEGRMLAAGPLEDVLGGESLETRFVELAGGATAVEGMEWLQSYSD